MAYPPAPSAVALEDEQDVRPLVRMLFDDQPHGAA
jgi:hypothetical protein